MILNRATFLVWHTFRVTSLTISLIYEALLVMILTKALRCTDRDTL